MRLVDSPRPSPGGPLRADVEPARPARARPASSGSSCPAGTSASSERGAGARRTAAVAGRGGRDPPARGRQGRRGGLGARRGLGARPARGGDRGDRPRLRPACSRRSTHSWRTCGATWRWRSALGKPAILHCRSEAGGATPRTRCSPSWSAGFAARIPAPGARSAAGRRPSSIPSRVRWTTGERHRRWGSRCRSAGSCSGAGRRPSAEVAPLVPADRLLVETDSPFLSPPGAPRRRNEPEYGSA